MGDYIDRENYCKTICRCDRDYCDKGKCPIWTAPSADVRPVVRGRWVKIYEDGEPAVAQHQVGVCCSKCMRMPEDKFTESDFCPHCGADMREAK